MSPTQLAFVIAPESKAQGLAACKSHPHIVVFLGWFHAKLSHLRSYSARYSSMYPSAVQIVIQSDFQTVAGIQAANIAKLGPAVDLLAEYGVLSAAPPPMLFHVMSGGGAAQMYLLSLAINKRHIPSIPPSHKVPFALVFDSGPGSYVRVDLRRAVTASVPAGLRRLVFLGVAELAVTHLQARAAICLGKMPQDTIVPALVNPSLFPWMDRATPRLYIFSDADRVIPASRVRAHLRAARENGLNVTTEEFSGTAHVRHAFADPERYWRSVDNIWREANAIKGQSRL
ncbi:unnamed protein product [Mycena citricolor]|uniref:Uncharacterized protein n=1 Tax=Mycena citricolor TaxID=2018698 RepID=A0AAD2K219_9AGAR|nr:unnamed protein product [Mycena citricolor]